MTEEKSKWVKYGAIFAIIIMLGSGVLAVSMLLDDSAEPTEHSLKDIKGPQADFTFKNAKDGVKYLPEGVINISITRITPGDNISANLDKSFPNVTLDACMVGIYETGMVEYYSVKDNNNGKIVLSGKPKYDKYGGFNLIRASVAQRVIVGDPIIIASFFNYRLDSTLGNKVVDVLTGKANGATNFNDILSYADDTEIYNEITVFKANERSNFSKYYQRSSQYENGTILLETIVLNPSESMKSDIVKFAEPSMENATVSVIENGPAMKIYITGQDYISFAMKANELYTLTYSHTNQSD